MPPPSRPEEVLIPLPAKSRDLVPVATKFRSTWLTTSLRAIRARERFDEYLTYLPRAHHEAVLATVAGTWLPIEIAMAHYEATDRLGFSGAELSAIGREVHHHAQATVFSLMVKLASGAGATPWAVVGQLQRLWERVWVGGAVGVYKLGPKEVRIEVAGWPCARYVYARHALRAVVTGAIEMFRVRAYTSEIPRLCTPLTLGYRCAWA